MEEVLELEGVFAGNHISDTCAKAAVLVEKTGKSVHFEFNGIHVTAQPGQSAETLQMRWQRDTDAAAKAWREDPQRKVEAAAREAEEKRLRELHMTEPAMTEAEMRDAKVPWPKTPEQLTEYINSLIEKQHDYGTCVYALSMAAEAAFNYVASQLGVSGFQSSMADLDFLRRVRGMKGPFMLIKGEDALYPQYDLPSRLAKSMEEWKPWLKEQAKANLREGFPVHPDVEAHWRKLAADSSAHRD